MKIVLLHFTLSLVSGYFVNVNEDPKSYLCHQAPAYHLNSIHSQDALYSRISTDPKITEGIQNVQGRVINSVKPPIGCDLKKTSGRSIEIKPDSSKKISLISLQNENKEPPERMKGLKYDKKACAPEEKVQYRPEINEFFFDFYQNIEMILGEVENMEYFLATLLCYKVFANKIIIKGDPNTVYASLGNYIKEMVANSDQLQTDNRFEAGN
ncbi:hypothetical protein AYI68_g1604 [Smittium mucronatum]|uniref:Uncharacterized protein n=1 Tax=Smittium mucronatum TaxID=133383 RepID=A0A1R0H4Y6_9FUNG|nr:hypothetical protein AYI68_g1604 [Smittium mucronatum]